MKKTFKTLAIISIVLLVIFTIYLVVINIKFNQDCKGHLKRAADANTVELATSELKTSIDYLEANGDTIGYTSIIYKTPDEDINFWYHNLKASYNELVAIPDTASNLEKTNTLMKLRETLLDNGGDYGDHVTMPSGMSRYPHNRAYCIIFVVLILFSCGFNITSEIVTD